MEYRVKEKQVRDWRQEKDALIIMGRQMRQNYIFDAVTTFKNTSLSYIQCPSLPIY